MSRILKLDDAIKIYGENSILDKCNNFTLKGEVSIFDKNTNEWVIKKRDNLIVLRGRTWTLESVFKKEIGQNGVNTGIYAYQNDLSRFVCCFGVGSGGGPDSDKFATYAVQPTGVEGSRLSSPIPFRLHDPLTVADGNLNTYIPSLDILKYGDAAVPTNTQMTNGASQEALYYNKKIFDSSAWYFSEEENKVYLENRMSVSKYDCRALGGLSYINELALFIAKYDGYRIEGSPANLSKLEMFSRITFPSHPLSENTSLDIWYRIYA